MLSFVRTRALPVLILAAATFVMIAGPAPNAAAAGATVVTTGDEHSCAVTKDGAAQCWGNNELGQIGVGELGGPDICGGQGSDEVPCATTPRTVSGLGSGVQAISAGRDFTCALLANGTVSCWGVNDDGQLGAEATGPQSCMTIFDHACSSSPLQIPGITDAIDVSAGGAHACALMTGGGVKCWGGNYFGQLGNGSLTGPEMCGTTACSTTPVDVMELSSGVVKVSAGGSHTCALMDDGKIKCWGVNSKGELGIGNHDGPEDCYSGRVCSSSPLDVPGLMDMQDVSAGGSHTCALTDEGGVKCWGSNLFGQLGVGSTTGPDNCLDILSSPCSETPAQVVGLTSGVEYLNESASDTACAVVDGGAKCWGANNLSQMGIGSNSGPETCEIGFKCSTTPMSVMDLSDVMAVASGGEHGCALTTDNGVRCWGYKYHGVTGDNTWSPSNAYAHTPVDVIGLEGGPQGPELVQGDNDCDGDEDAVDALKLLQFVGGLVPGQEPACPLIGGAIPAGGDAAIFGDIDCDHDVDATDALKLLQYTAAIPFSQNNPCPDVGQPL